MSSGDWSLKSHSRWSSHSSASRRSIVDVRGAHNRCVESLSVFISKRRERRLDSSTRLVESSQMFKCNSRAKRNVQMTNNNPKQPLIVFSINFSPNCCFYNTWSCGVIVRLEIVISQNRGLHWIESASLRYWQMFVLNESLRKIAPGENFYQHCRRSSDIFTKKREELYSIESLR